jgi:Nickel responsive protein SCO4226-like
MALFIIERNFAQEIAIEADTVKALLEINGNCRVKWLTSFLSADKRKTYCLYEATNPDDLREAARQANIPADAIVELSGEINPAAFA